MRICVGIPAYNAAPTVARVVEAVLGQTRAADEIIVIDDASTDGTGAEAAAAGARVLTHSRNLGLAAARNTIWRATEADVVVYFDADAVPYEDCIASLLRPFRKKRVGAVGGRGLEAAIVNSVQRWRARTTPQDHGTHAIDGAWMVMGLCCAFRRDALEKVGGFDASFERAGEDVDISIRLAQAGFTLVYEPKAQVDHVPGGGLYAVTRQAFRHSYFASYALGKNRKSAKPYLTETVRHLSRSAAGDLAEGRLGDTMIGLVNLAARAAGCVMGRAVAQTAIHRGRPAPPAAVAGVDGDGAASAS
ncbi:glycosyltransferase, partial [bacterium]|nr:glycosyltransferase [bacterium]